MDCPVRSAFPDPRRPTGVRGRRPRSRGAERGIRDLQFERDSYVVAPELQPPRRFFATTGISVDRQGINHSEDVTVAARNALLNMIDHLVAEYGCTPQQADAICSVAVDLKISEMAHVPNFVVSAFLPLDVTT